MKIKANTLYRVKYNWGTETRFGIGFACNLGEDENTTFGISLPESGVMNVSKNEALEILEIGVAIKKDGKILIYN